MPRRSWTMRVSDEENAMLKLGAKLRGKGNTVFVRDAALAAARQAIARADKRNQLPSTPPQDTVNP